MNIKKCILFDLDGTLIDSSKSILSSLEKVFEASKIKANQPFSPNLIGPPLEAVVRSLLDPQDKKMTESLIEAFKQEYDNNGYLLTQVYEGVPCMLKNLTKSGISLCIATNKRINPTRKILNFLGWDSYFEQVFTLDYFVPTLKNKSELLSKLMLELDSEICFYVGDREDDWVSAKNANIPFLFASWGYSLTSSIVVNKIQNPQELELIMRDTMLLQGSHK